MSQVNPRVRRFMALATKEALQSPMKFRHGAVLAKGGRIISKGCNNYRRTIDGSYYLSTHAEMEVLRKVGQTAPPTKLADRSDNSYCNFPSKGADLFVVRVGRVGLSLHHNSRPCPTCVGWLHRYGVKRVFYTVRKPSGTAPGLADQLNTHDHNGLEPENDDDDEGEDEEEEEEEGENELIPTIQPQPQQQQNLQYDQDKISFKDVHWRVEKVEDMLKEVDRMQGTVQDTPVNSTSLGRRVLLRNVDDSFLHSMWDMRLRARVGEDDSDDEFDEEEVDGESDDDSDSEDETLQRQEEMEGVASKHVNSFDVHNPRLYKVANLRI
ncbi:Ran GTPase activating protein 1 [Balamuthia mandrillaris]